jgi:putative transposase
VLDRHGLVERRGRLRRRAQGTPLSLGQRPNELWCTDYKGEFLLGNHQYCYPRTVTEHARRFLLTCEARSSTREDYAFTVFERLFRERGLPANIRSDNGVPFASAHALFNLSKLAVWWLRLGIGIERIKPGHPQQNGRHERMHLTLKKEATKPATANFLQQQARFDKFTEVFNNERPHKALGMKYPAEIYQPSPGSYTGLPDMDYPMHDKTIVVTRCGRICLGRKKINFSQVFAGLHLHCGVTRSAEPVASAKPGSRKDPGILRFVDDLHLPCGVYLRCAVDLTCGMKPGTPVLTTAFSLCLV